MSFSIARARDARPRFNTIHRAIIALVLLPLTGFADHTPAPMTVTIPGNFQQELGCPDDWQPWCAVTDLTFDANLQLWEGTFNIPAGSWEYKVAINSAWDENYGRGGVPGGDNLILTTCVTGS